MKQLFIFILFMGSLAFVNGQDTLKPHLRKEVFDFQIGDVFQYEHIWKSYEPWGYSGTTYTQVTTLAKRVSNDTIFYDNEIKKLFLNGSIQTDYLQDTIPYRDSSIFFALPTYVPDSLMHLYKIKNTIYKNENNFSPGNSLCKNSVLLIGGFKGLTNYREYMKGLGCVSQYYDYYSQPIDYQGKTFRKNISYYKKGNKTYGKPVDFTTALEEKQQETNVSIFPNPASNVLFIRQLEVDLLYKLYDINSKTVKQGDITPNTNSIDIANIPKGVYFIQLFNQKNKLPLFQQKIIIY